MELWQAIRTRRSIRKFKPDPVPEEAVRALLEAARLAPSGVNLQPWRFVIVKSQEAREKLKEATPLPFVVQAPVIFVCCVDCQVFSKDTVESRVLELKQAGALAGDFNAEEYARRRAGEEAAARAYLSLNAAIAIDHLTLRAVDLGLGTCWVMMFDQEKVKKALVLEDRYLVTALIPVGYPDQQPAQRPRLSAEEILIKQM